MTSADQVSIGPIELRHEEQWRVLWQEYLRFYGSELAEEVTAHTWRRMFDHENVIGLGALRSARLVGFAIAILHEATWSMGRTAYLEDLFVRSEERGRGVGRKLIEGVVDRARQLGCTSIYWHTQAGNRTARKLYDSFVTADDFVRYRLPI